jgi:hypothetical protein
MWMCCLNAPEDHHETPPRLVITAAKNLNQGFDDTSFSSASEAFFGQVK